MASSNSLRFAGDVLIKKILITTNKGRFVDITPQVLSVELFEDLFSPFFTGSLVIKDSLDLVNVMPFAGEEYVTLDIETPTLKSGNIKQQFYIYKLSNREIIGDRSVVYQLNFISIEAIFDLNKRVSKVFTGNVGDMVNYIVKDKLNGLQSEKNITLDQTTKNHKFISNLWSPVKVLTHLTEYAQNKNGTPSYTFFENRTGFNFVSLESLYTQPLYQQFVYDKYTRDVLPDGRTVRNVAEDYKRITGINIPTGFDYIDRIRNGMFSSKIISYDLTRKKYNVKNYNLFEDFDKTKHLNKYNMASKTSIFRNNSLIINQPRMYSNFSGFGDATNYEIIQKRISLMKLAEANKIEISVFGRCDYTVGQKVYVKLNKIEQLTKKDKDDVDTMFSGNYIISAVNHRITPSLHECHMELIKDTLQMNLDGNK